MAIPVLYWMIECTKCGARRVVHDSWLLPVPDPEGRRITGGGHGGPALPERHGCVNACSAPMRAIGSLREPTDTRMWLHDPHLLIDLDDRQIEEWRELIRREAPTH